MIEMNCVSSPGNSVASLNIKMFFYNRQNISHNWRTKICSSNDRYNLSGDQYVKAKLHDIFNLQRYAQKVITN